VYVDFAGERVFDVETGRLLLRRLEQAVEEIRARGKFGDDAARARIIAIYDDTAKDLTKRIARRGKP
jgi:hypothetical protein